MNQYQQQAIQNAIDNAKDNLARAKLQKQADPNWISGNGDTIDEMIAIYELQISRLTENT